MGREVEYEEDAICDICGKEGAYDFMGDCLCPQCAEKYVGSEEDGK
jgi:uncharacterized Zn ribbon protein